MADVLDKLTWEDKIVLKLRALFEGYGYRRYYMGKFEPYDMYRENMNFLKTDTVITFTDPGGALMALKPDVTMSIVKNTRPEITSQKLFYIENVFRMTSGAREYREISQIGIESIGGNDGYTQAEAVALAIKSLELISHDYLLCVSHMGFVSAAFEACSFDAETSRLASDALSRKSLGALLEIAYEKNLPPESIKLLEAITGISAPAAEALPKLRALSLSGDMLKALSEIELLIKTLSQSTGTDKVRLDFTLINDLDYYTGVVFQGYVEGIPKAVLSGGRYDNLMRRFNKPQPAIGFALYLGELSRGGDKRPDFDVDALIIYGGAPPEIVMRAVEDLVRDGKSVRVEAATPCDVRARQIYVLDSSGKMEVRLDD